MTTSTATKPLTEQTPQEIDEQLAEIYGRYYRALDDHQHLSQLASHYADPKNGMERYYEEYLQKAAQAIELAASIWDEMIPFKAEFNRRGRWTRAYLVTNTGGHVHRSMNCATCFPTTRFDWLTDLSAHAETEIVEMAGEIACTVCYPSAPVEVLKRKSQIELPARKAARLEREAKQAAKKAKQLIDPQTGEIVREVEVPFGRNPQPGPLPGGLRLGREIGKTERGAELAAISGLASLLWYGPTHPSAPGWTATAERVAYAIAKKHDMPVGIVTDRLQAKAAASHKRAQKG